MGCASPEVDGFAKSFIERRLSRVRSGLKKMGGTYDAGTIRRDGPPADYLVTLCGEV